MMQGLISRLAFLVMGASMVTSSSVAADLAFREPTVPARQGAYRESLQGARRAVNSLYAACRQHDPAGVEAALTSDGVVSYALEQAGTYLAVDGEALSALCADHAEGLDSNASLTDFWIFPTAEANTVFIQYRASHGSGFSSFAVDHLLVVEMRGERISKLRDLTAVAPDRVALSASLARFRNRSPDSLGQAGNQIVGNQIVRP
jgi:hypothetical protein